MKKFVLLLLGAILSACVPSVSSTQAAQPAAMHAPVEWSTPTFTPSIQPTRSVLFGFNACLDEADENNETAYVGDQKTFDPYLVKATNSSLEIYWKAGDVNYTLLVIEGEPTTMTVTDSNSRLHGEWTYMRCLRVTPNGMPELKIILNDKGYQQSAQVYVNSSQSP